MCIYKIAKKIVESREKQCEKIEQKRKEDSDNRYSEWRLHQELISSMATKYLSELVEVYTSKNKPKFSEGQKVLLHPYYKADGWEPSGYELFSHTPYNGPVEVIIDSIGIDTGRAYEKIMDHARDRDTFNKIQSNSQYNQFKDLARNIWSIGMMHYEKIMYSYSFHIPDSDRQYWKYQVREDKFLLPNSQAGKAAKKIATLKKKRKDLEIKIKEVQTEYNELYNLMY